MSNVRVMNTNYIDSASYVAMTYSSQTTAAPASNVTNYVRRSKTWRSAGYWEVTSSNRGIVFQDSIGVNLTANIAVANYATDAAFLAAIKTAMQAVGAATYTVTRNTTTKKITIASNGAAFQLMCTNVAFTAASLLGFSASVDRTGALTYTADLLKIHSYEWMKWDFGTSVNPKAFILIGLRNSPIKLSATATITLEASATDLWTSPAYSVTIPYKERAIATFADAGLAAYRWWRLKITDQANPNGYVEVSNLYLGDSVVTTQGAVQFPLTEKDVDPSDVQYSRSGNGFSDEVQKTATFAFEWKNLNVTELEALRDFRRQVGNTKPFFIAFDPNAAFSSDSSVRTHFVRFDADVQFDLTDPGLFDSKWSIREEV